MALFQVGIDVSRYQGSINWSAVAAAGKQFAIVRIGSSTICRGKLVFEL